MLQQTTVQTVIPFYEKFLRLWPNVTALAQAPVEAVMLAWAGLGYYSRARNLHKCAGVIARDFCGVFPSNEHDLLQLPGVGPYTAAAIAAIAFGHSAVVVDGNIERVVTRLFAIATPMPGGKRDVRVATGQITPLIDAGDFAQALMDIGATICAPRNPNCLLCPLQAHCAAHASGEPARFPLKGKKTPRPQRNGTVYFARRMDGMVLVRTRPPKGLLGGMVEFPGFGWAGDQDELTTPPLAADWRIAAGEVRHVFTHFSLALRVHFGMVSLDTPAPQGMRFVAETALPTEALPTVMQKVLRLASVQQ